MKIGRKQWIKNLVTFAIIFSYFYFNSMFCLKTCAGNNIDNTFKVHDVQIDESKMISKNEIGWKIDENGDIYYKNISRYLSNEFYLGVYFDEKGRMSASNKFYDDECRALENGEGISVFSYSDIENLVNYYTQHYRIQSQVTNASIKNNKLYLNKSEVYDREMLSNLVFNMFYTGDIEKDKGNIDLIINNICNNLGDYYTYDTKYSIRSMEEAIANKKAVCWHLVKTVNICLSKLDIDSEFVYVRTKSGEHVILRCKQYGKWKYYDIYNMAMYKNFVNYSNISYDKIFELYSMSKHFSFNE